MIVRTKTLHQTYDKIADDYSNSIALVNAFNGRFYIKNMPRNKGTILDAGCGTGDILAKLSKYFRQSYGIDPVEKFVLTAKQRARTSDIRAGYVEKLPFGDQSMDYVISHVVFQHVDRDRALKEIVRVLKPGGRLIVSEVLSQGTAIQTPVLNFYKWLLINTYLLSRYGIKRAKWAKTYQTSSDWKNLTSIHRARRFSLVQLQDFYSQRLSGAKFKRIDSKIVAVIWDKPQI